MTLGELRTQPGSGHCYVNIGMFQNGSISLSLQISQNDFVVLEVVRNLKHVLNYKEKHVQRMPKN